VFQVPSSMFQVLVLCSVLGSGFGVPGSSFHEHSNTNQEQNTEQEPGTRNLEPGTASATLWCPMHPNVRGSEPGAKCNECGMALVPIPDRTDASYWLDAATNPPAIPIGRPFSLRLTVRDRGTGEVVPQFDDMHERPMHLFVVSSDLQFFDHVHPEIAADGSFDIALTLPRAGAYRLVADVLPTGATPQTLQHTLLTTGYVAAALRLAREPKAESLEATDGDVRARLDTRGARAGDDAHVVIALSDRQSGAPVTDIEPYLGAWGHMFLASHDLADVVHSHPLIEQTVAHGPTITFQTLFTRSGWYRVWTQVQRRGRLLTFGFTVRVGSAL
jgi:Heavy metal binding domain